MEKRSSEHVTNYVDTQTGPVKPKQNSQILLFNFMEIWSNSGSNINILFNHLFNFFSDFLIYEILRELQNFFLLKITLKLSWPPKWHLSSVCSEHKCLLQSKLSIIRISKIEVGISLWCIYVSRSWGLSLFVVKPLIDQNSICLCKKVCKVLKSTPTISHLTSYIWDSSWK